METFYKSCRVSGKVSVIAKCNCKECCSFDYTGLINTKIKNHLRRCKNIQLGNGIDEKCQKHHQFECTIPSIVSCPFLEPYADIQFNFDDDSESQFGSQIAFRKVFQKFSRNRHSKKHIETCHNYYRNHLLSKSKKWFARYRLFITLRKAVFFAEDCEWKQLNDKSYAFLIKRKSLRHKLCQETKTNYLQLWYDSKLSNNKLLLQFYFSKWKNKRSQDVHLISFHNNRFQIDAIHKSLSSSNSSISSTNSYSVIKEKTSYHRIQMQKHFKTWVYNSKNKKYYDDLIDWSLLHYERHHALFCFRQWISVIKTKRTQIKSNTMNRCKKQIKKLQLKRLFYRWWKYIQKIKISTEVYNESFNTRIYYLQYKYFKTFRKLKGLDSVQ